MIVDIVMSVAFLIVNFHVVLGGSQKYLMDYDGFMC